MSVRPIFAILIAFAMLLVPFAMPAGAMAMAPADEHSQMKASDHCGDQSSDGKDGKDGKTAGKSCCVATCVAVAVAPISPREPQLFAQAVDRPALFQLIQGYLAELATPPPRRA